MSTRRGPRLGWLGRWGRCLRSIAATTLLIVGCLVAAGCGLHAGTLELPQTPVASRTAYPWRVGVVVDKAFAPYKTKFRYWSSTPFTWSLNGLPEALAETLKPYFLSVDLLPAGRSVSEGAYDVIAKMSVDQLRFDGANTTVGNDRVDLVMTLTLEQPNGTQIFRTSVAESASTPYSQPCAFCKPDPSEAFTKVFRAAFIQLSERLGESDIQPVREWRQSLRGKAGVHLTDFDAATSTHGCSKRPTRNCN